MFKHRSVVFSLLLFLLPIAAVFAQTINTPPVSSDLQALIHQLQEQIKTLQARIFELETNLAVQKEELKELKIELRISRSLYKGVEGDDVKELQEFLKQFPDIYPEGLVTGFFGSLTEAAVRRFQEKNDIETIGIVGPKTLSRINELYIQRIPTPSGTIPAIPAQPRGQTGTTTIPATPAIPASHSEETGTTTIPAPLPAPSSVSLPTGWPSISLETRQFITGRVLLIAASAGIKSFTVTQSNGIPYSGTLSGCPKEYSNTVSFFSYDGLTASVQTCDGKAYDYKFVLLLSGIYTGVAPTSEITYASPTATSTASTTSTSTTTTQSQTTPASQTSTTQTSTTAGSTTTSTQTTTSTGTSTTTSSTTTSTTSGTATTAATMPAAPGMPSSVYRIENMITLSWGDKSSNETRFEIQKGAAYSGPYTKIGEVGSNVTSFSYQETVAGTYIYNIAACNSAGCSTSTWSDLGGLSIGVPSSVTTTTTTTSNTPPPAPTGGTNAGAYTGAGGANTNYSMHLRFNYDISAISQVQSFRFYRKRPTDSAFILTDTFTNPSTLSSACSGSIAGVAGSLRYYCTSAYWSVDLTSQSSSQYPAGEYQFYVTAVTSSGAESSPSPTLKITVVTPTTVLRPTEVQSPVAAPPVFEWTTGGSHGYIQVFVEGSQSPFYSKSVSNGATSFTYDGAALDPAKKYLLLIHTPGTINRTSDGDSTSDVSFAEKVEKFWVSASATTTASSFNQTISQMAALLQSLRRVLEVMLASLR